MASHGRDDENGFLSRWSQRKREAGEAAGQEVETPQGDERPQRVATAGAAALPAAENDAERIDPRDLPDIDTLDAGSDFSVFLKKGVPRALKRRALRRLWQVDPAFSVHDGLTDYNLDYTDAATVMPNLKTLYQVGRGMIMPGEDDEEDAADATVAEAEALPAPEAAAVEAEADPALAAETEDAALPPPPESASGGAPPARREPRKPSGPRVSGATTPRSSVSRPEPRSARQRRWGDPDSQ